MSDILLKIQEWYLSHCNGIWEHQSGIRIDTLDNPGWTVTIDLRGTELASAEWPEFRVDRGNGDWIFCWKENERFRGSGDPMKLNAILQYFVDLSFPRRGSP
jgi:hypothetical protein